MSPDNIDELIALVREVVDEEPRNTCADEGTTCLFCGEDYDYQRYHAGGKLVTHSSNCWFTRARELLEKLNR